MPNERKYLSDQEERDGQWNKNAKSIVWHILYWLFMIIIFSVRSWYAEWSTATLYLIFHLILSLFNIHLHQLGKFSFSCHLRIVFCRPFSSKSLIFSFLFAFRFIEYNPTSLERNYKYEVLTEHDLGVTIDLINKDTYALDFSSVLDPADEKLLEEDAHTLQDSKRCVGKRYVLLLFVSLFVVCQFLYF